MGKYWTSVYVERWIFFFLPVYAGKLVEAVLFCITWSSNMSCQPAEQCNIIDSWLFTELQKAESLLFKITVFIVSEI